MLATSENERLIERGFASLRAEEDALAESYAQSKETILRFLLEDAANGDPSEVVDWFDGQDKLAEFLVLFAKYRNDPQRLGTEVLRECWRMFEATAKTLADKEQKFN